MTRLTSLEKLKENITLLASVAESDSPFISCYLNLEHGIKSCLNVLDERTRILRRTMKSNDLVDLEEAVNSIKDYLTRETSPEAKGIALFARGKLGGKFILPMQFAVPLPDWIVVYPTPNIFHLVALKENYHHYVVMVTTEAWVRIIEVNLGAASVQAWEKHPELRQRVGQEWSRVSYERHQFERGDRFFREKIAVLERLIQVGGHTHFILAGDPSITKRFRRALPKSITDILVMTIPVEEEMSEADVVAATLSAFIHNEEQESQVVADRLVEGIRTHGLAVAGPAASLYALRWGEVDSLVIAKDYEPNPGWICTYCNSMGVGTLDVSLCPQCGEEALRPLNTREALIRLAGQRECSVEIVEHSEKLMRLGGVGCLLCLHGTLPTQGNRSFQVLADES